MEHSPEGSERREVEHATFKSYALGFILSVLLTLGAFFAVSEHLLSGRILFWALTVLALLQALVQLLLFLHLDKERKPHWNLLTFFCMLSILIIIIFGSLWIMAELDYNVMPEMKGLYK